jgi:hypothetical protein
MSRLAVMAIVWTALSFGLGASIVGAGSAHGSQGLIGKWRAPVKDGLQETLDLYANGAYRSVTNLVDPDAWRTVWEKSCQRGKRKPKSKDSCDQKAIDKSLSIFTWPDVTIGTYTIESARIEFTHGCSEGVEGCGVTDVKDTGVFFVEGDTLTIKLDGQRYRRSVVGGGTSTYLRQP